MINRRRRRRKANLVAGESMLKSTITDGLTEVGSAEYSADTPQDSEEPQDMFDEVDSEFKKELHDLRTLRPPHVNAMTIEEGESLNRLQKAITQSDDPFLPPVTDDVFSSEGIGEIGLTTSFAEINSEDDIAVMGTRSKKLSEYDKLINGYTISGGNYFGKKATFCDASEVQKVYIPKVEEITGALTPADNEDFDDLRESFEIKRSDESTFVFAIAIDKEGKENKMSAIKCSGGTAFGGFAYDRSKDSYIVNCVDFVEIGRMYFSYLVSMKNMSGWKMKTPISQRVLNKNFTIDQKKKLDDFRDKWATSKYQISFIQLLGCN